MKRSIIIAVCICLAVSALTGCKTDKRTDKHVITIDETLNRVYGEIIEEESETGYKPGSVQKLRMDTITTGAFTEEGADEYLAVVLTEDEIPHAAGLYHAYMAVFNAVSGEIESELKHFRADEGDYSVFRGAGKTYVFFTGAVVYQGDAQRSGGLYSVEDGKWTIAWPEDEDFWNDHMVDIRSTGLRVMEKRIVSSEGVIPEITWDFAYFLGWVEDTDSFVVTENEY